ncbi:MAG: hypothetical protein ACTSRU_00480 [Candidatus Hodarchaeales archaeon]
MISEDMEAAEILLKKAEEYDFDSFQFRLARDRFSKKYAILGEDQLFEEAYGISMEDRFAKVVDLENYGEFDEIINIETLSDEDILRDLVKQASSEDILPTMSEFIFKEDPSQTIGAEMASSDFIIDSVLKRSRKITLKPIESSVIARTDTGSSRVLKTRHFLSTVSSLTDSPLDSSILESMKPAAEKVPLSGTVDTEDIPPIDSLLDEDTLKILELEMVTPKSQDDIIEPFKSDSIERISINNNEMIGIGELETEQAGKIADITSLPQDETRINDLDVQPVEIQQIPDIESVDLEASGVKSSIDQEYPKIDLDTEIAKIPSSTGQITIDHAYIPTEAYLRVKMQSAKPKLSLLTDIEDKLDIESSPELEGIISLFHIDDDQKEFPPPSIDMAVEEGAEFGRSSYGGADTSLVRGIEAISPLKNEAVTDIIDLDLSTIQKSSLDDIITLKPEFISESLVTNEYNHDLEDVEIVDTVPFGWQIKEIRHEGFELVSKEIQSDQGVIYTWKKNFLAKGEKAKIEYVLIKRIQRTIVTKQENKVSLVNTYHSLDGINTENVFASIEFTNTSNKVIEHLVIEDIIPPEFVVKNCETSGKKPITLPTKDSVLYRWVIEDLKPGMTLTTRYSFIEKQATRWYRYHFNHWAGGKTTIEKIAQPIAYTEGNEYLIFIKIDPGFDSIVEILDQVPDNLEVLYHSPLWLRPAKLQHDDDHFLGWKIALEEKCRLKILLRVKSEMPFNPAELVIKFNELSSGESREKLVKKISELIDIKDLATDSSV